MTQLLYFISSWAETGAKKWTCQTGSCPRTEHWQKSNSGISPPRSCQYHHQPSAAARAGFARGFTGIPPLPTSEPVPVPSPCKLDLNISRLCKIYVLLSSFSPSLLSDGKSLIRWLVSDLMSSFITLDFSLKESAQRHFQNKSYVCAKRILYLLLW